MRVTEQHISNIKVLNEGMTKRLDTAVKTLFLLFSLALIELYTYEINNSVSE